MQDKIKEITEEDKKNCGVCRHWVGDTIDFRPSSPLKRMCLYPMTEGETFVSYSGYSKATE